MWLKCNLPALIQDVLQNFCSCLGIGKNVIHSGPFSELPFIFYHYNFKYESQVDVGASEEGLH